MELTIDGEVFRVEVEGAETRPAVLLSPALGSDLSLFDAQMPALLEHFRVVRYDPRGHGGSTVAGAPYSLARLGHDALSILDALEVETAHFIGVSMGGAVGQWLLVNAPQRIGRAVLANTSARLGSPAVWNTRIAAVLAHGMAALAEPTMERWFSPAFHAQAPERVAPVEAVFRETAAKGYAAACAALRDIDLRHAIEIIDRPVLIVTGREDEVTSAADVATMLSAIRGAGHVALDCRHISNIERDEAFNAAVVGFLTAPMPARPTRPRKPAARRRTDISHMTGARSPLKPSTARVDTARAKPAPAARHAARAAVADGPASKPIAKKAASKTPAADEASTQPAARRAASGSRKTAAHGKIRTTAAKSTAAKSRATKATPAKSTVQRSRAARTTAAKATPAKSTATGAITREMPAKKAAVSKAGAKKTAAKTATKAAQKTPAARRAADTQRRSSPKRPGRTGGRPKR